MKAKRLSAVLLTVIMLCMTFMTVVSAEEMTDDTLQIIVRPKLNGQYCSWKTPLKRGSTNTISIDEVSYGTEMVAAEKITYQWCSDLSGNDEIAGADSSNYQFTYNGEQGYSCQVTVSLDDGSKKSCSFSFEFVEDSLTVSGSSNLPYESDPEAENTLYVRNVAVGSGGTLTVTASSTAGKILSYKWDHWVVDSNWNNPETIKGATGNSYTFVKNDVGSEIYRCEVTEESNDMPKIVTFMIEPADTLKIEPKINGSAVSDSEIPGGIGYGGTGVLYGTQEGKKLNLQVNATSTAGPVTYSWTYGDENGVKEVGTSDTLSVTKADAEHSTYPGELGVQDYECWIEDGNARKRVLFSLYLMKSEASDITTSEGTLSVSVGEVTEDMNTFLKDSEEGKKALDDGNIVSRIKLDTGVKEQVEAKEEAVVNGALPQNGVVGMYLDINLYAEVVRAPSQDSSRVDARDIPLTETGSPVSITVEVPKSMLNTDSTVNRTYEVIRVHGDKADALGCEFDGEKNTVTFSTDKFSTYALAYADKKKPSGGGQGGSGEGQGAGAGGQGADTGVGGQGQQAGAGSQSQFQPVTVAPKTGDMAHVGGYAVMMLLASGVLGGIMKKRNAR